MRGTQALVPARRSGCRTPRRFIALVVFTLAGPMCAKAELASCPGKSDAPRIAEALSRIERSIDPCGDSAQIAALLKQLARCSSRTYRICTSAHIDRNVFDRPIGSSTEGLPITITWNPELRSELEPSCDGDRATPVFRDPTASLLHELAHAGQDCAGLDPSEHELEAVQVENVYRRSAGLCQRSRYGDQPLPSTMVKVCRADHCPCSAPGDGGGVHEAETHATGVPIPSGGSHPVTLVGDAAPVD